MRWPIECCFEEGKGELGMDHYELRFWRGGYHHMTLVILAHHFLVRLRQRLMPCAPPSTGDLTPSRLVELPEGAEGERGARTADTN